MWELGMMVLQQVVGCQIIFLLNYYCKMAMLLVETSNLAERQQLQQQFMVDNGVFQVPSRQFSLIATLLKSSTYQQFHASAPSFVLKMQELLVKSISGTLCLDLYRQVLQAIREQHQRFQLYQQYILQMNQAFEQDPIQLHPNDQLQQLQNLDDLFEEANRGEDRQTSILEMPQLPFLSLQSVRQKCADDLQSQLTKNTASSAIKSTKQNLGGVTKLTDFFYSASAIYSRDDWRTDRAKGKQSSREIESFKKKGEGVLQVNESLQSLLVDELAYDIKRQVLETAPLAKELKQRKQLQQRYNRKIKNTIIFSKIGLRRRK